MKRRQWIIATAVAGLLTAAVAPAQAQKKYGPGITDTEIKLGQTMPYSGPLSAYANIGRTELAFFKMINDQGGVNGRKINLISLDDAYQAPRTVEQTRKLVEEEEVLGLFQSLGTPTNTAIHKYINAKKVPHLFVATGATKWGDPKNFPWTVGYQPSYHFEGKIYARYILAYRPKGKIAILFQNDDYGKDYLAGFMEGLGAKGASMIVAETSYEPSDPTIDSQIVSLKASGADVFFNITTPKFAAQAIRKAHDIGWKPLHLLNNVSSSVSAVLKPAGLEASKDLITALYMKEVTDPQWASDKGFLDWMAFMKKYYPEGNTQDQFNAYGYTVAMNLVHVLRQAGNDLSRENIMRQAANMKNLELPLLLPGIRINTSSSDFAPIQQEQLGRFNGERWVLFGNIYDSGQ